MKARNALLGAALAALAAVLILALPEPAEAAFARRFVITVGVGQVAGGPHPNFPMLLSFQHNNLRSTANGGLVTSDAGDDILLRGEDVTTCAGASPCVLDHEIESYDPVSGTIVLWVRVPSVNDGTAIYLYYADAAVTCSQENTAGVWDSDYREVFHLNETGDYTDSTANGFTAVAQGSVDQGVAGKVGPAADFLGNTGEARLIASDDELPANMSLPGTNSLTIEAWLRLDTLQSGQFAGFVTKGRDDGIGAPQSNWVGLFKTGTDRLSFGWPCCSGAVPNPLPANLDSTFALVTGTWYYAVATYDAVTGDRQLYLNGGAPDATDSKSAIHPVIPEYLRIGDDSNGYFHDGLIDEVRISTTVRSQPWLQTTYDNQNAPGTFHPSVVDDGSPPVVTASCSGSVNPCAGGPGSCNLRSIGTAVDYSLNTVSATNASDVVTGASTGWQSANRGRGDDIDIAGVPYTVLAVDSETSLRLTVPYAGVTGALKPYTISRTFNGTMALQTWADCVTGGGGCAGVTSDLTPSGDNRSEIGIVYDDGTAYLPAGAGNEIFFINGSTTDPTHTITLTADPGNRHFGRAGDGVVLDNTGNSSRAVVIQDQYVTLEWLEILGGSGAGNHCLDYQPASSPNHSVFRNNIIRNCTGQSVRLAGGSNLFGLDIVGNVIYGGAREGIALTVTLQAGSRVRVLNNTLLGNSGGEVTAVAAATNPYLLLRNNIMIDDGGSPDFDGTAVPWINVGSSHNITGDASPSLAPCDPGPPPAGTCFNSDVGHSPRSGGVYAATEAAVNFVDATPGSEDLHIQTGSIAWAAGADLSGVFQSDIDATIRTIPWDIGADELVAGSAPPLVAYSDTSGASPRPLDYSFYQGGTWSAPGSTAVPGPFTAGWPLYSKVARTRPDGGQRAVVFNENYLPGQMKLFASLWDGTNWDDGSGAPFNDAQAFGNAGFSSPLTYRHFDAAYEPLSGELLVVTGINVDEAVNIYTYNGTAWSGNLRFSPVGNGNMPNNGQDAANIFEWVHLAPSAYSNRIAFIGIGNDEPVNDSAVISAAIWDGDTNTFGSKVIHSWPVTGPDGITPQNPHFTDAADIDFVLAGANLGEAVAVWGTQSDLWSNIWNSSTGWAGNALVASTGAPIRWIRQKAQPRGDDLILMVENLAGNIRTIRYNGNTRAFEPAVTPTGITAAYGNADYHRPADIVWDVGSGPDNLLLVYSDATGIRYHVSSDGGASWGAQQTLTAAYQAYWVQLERDPSDIVHLIIHDAADDLRGWYWDGVAWTVSTPAVISTNLERDANHAVEPFALATYPPQAGTTAVELLSFGASPLNSAVALEWRTGSELDNLGFHLHRSLSENGPWTRVTPSLIPGLGSSPEGASYSFRDTALLNGTTYFYRLEDIDAASGSTFHGPISAIPSASTPGEEEGGEDPEESGDSSDPESSGEQTAYGAPGEPSFRVVSRKRRSIIVELTTPGFAATETPTGVRVSVPGFDARRNSRAPAVPLKRALLDGLVGRRARIVWAKEKNVLSFPGLTPAAVGGAEIVVARDGTVRPRRRGRSLKKTRSRNRVLPRSAVRIAGDAFIGEAKKLALEMSPIRYDTRSRTLLLARTLRVKIAFDRKARTKETGRGSRGRRRPRSARRASETGVLAHLHTLQTGLHAVSFEALSLSGPVPLDSLRLSLLGEPVPFHVKPRSSDFRRGSVLFFHAASLPSSMDFSSETTYALERASGGVRMGRISSRLKGLPKVSSAPLAQVRFETNRFYQPGLLDAPDIWLWDFMVGGMSKSVPFSVEGLDSSSSQQAQIQVVFQGASDSESENEHHLSVSLNGTPLGETSFDGKLAHVFSTSFSASLLLEGQNSLTLTNLGDTGAYSFVFLDRVDLVHPQKLALRQGRFEGLFSEGGKALVSGKASYGVDVTDPGAPRWLRSLKSRKGRVRFKAEAGHRYLLASSGGLLSPRVSRPVKTTLRSQENQADYVVIAPEAFLPAAQPLLERRRDQGLTTKAISFEQITSEFGYGRPSAQAIRDFLAYAFHNWTAPSVKYVLLLGDASSDPRNFTGRDKGAPLPAFWAKTSYLWTSSDPTLAAVNGEDGLPDLAIGRLPATTLEEAKALVQKVLAWEDTAQSLSGKVVLVADNPDIAGDFEADIADIRASFLAGTDTQSILLSQHGANTRSEVLGALDQGASILSYVGHGGPAVWASENVLNSWDPPSLLAQSAQPLMLTFNCLNGYFVAPNYDSLAEAFMKVEGRGTIGAFSPSGLSLDGPAHRFHKALMAEIVSGEHERLGDAVLAAQAAYAETGLMPELLAVYHLFGDPGMRIR